MQNLDLRFLDNFECPICLNNFLPEIELFSVSECQHRLCTQCAQEYFLVQINEKAFPISCPMNNCKTLIPPESVRLLLPDDVATKFDRFLLVHSLESDPDWRPCLTPGCENGGSLFLRHKALKCYGLRYW
eukprot:TRINITY_DN1074_c0_g2_i8.p1 TRINITY_DN1074_c0_g2~~TRINITY_DN1074_c0_g2_i8.p1  ORF type:complete len:141 (-),score=14.30 TRINITY_DN1074_c0_g2_i8:455-844(-)